MSLGDLKEQISECIDLTYEFDSKVAQKGYDIRAIYAAVAYHYFRLILLYRPDAVLKGRLGHLKSWAIGDGVGLSFVEEWLVCGDGDNPLLSAELKNQGKFVLDRLTKAIESFNAALKDAAAAKSQ